MKRLAVILISLLATVTLGAQSRYGVIGGLTFSNAPKVSEISFKTATLYHGGLTYQYLFTQGFSIQPSLLFNMRGANNEDKSGFVRVGAVELPVAFQWGPDLLAFRPFIELVPYIGANVFCSDKAIDMKTLEGGIGLGGGIEVWKFQLSARYNWNLNPYALPTDGIVAWAFRSVTLSLAVLF